MCWENQPRIRVNVLLLEENQQCVHNTVLETHNAPVIALAQVRNEGVMAGPNIPDAGLASVNAKQEMVYEWQYLVHSSSGMEEWHPFSMAASRLLCTAFTGGEQNLVVVSGDCKYSVDL